MDTSDDQMYAEIIKDLESMHKQPYSLLAADAPGRTRNISRESGNDITTLTIDWG